MWRALLLVACVLCNAGRAAAARTTPRCPDATYLIAGTPGGAGSIADAVTISGSKVALGPGCPPRKGAVQGTKRGTKVHVAWRRCSNLRKVALRALIEPTCTTMTGTLKAKGQGALDIQATSAATVTTTTMMGTGSSTTTTTTRAGSTTTTSTYPSRTCDESDRARLEAVAASGGTLDFACAGRIALEHAVVIGGASVILRGFVTIGRGDGLSSSPPPFRLFEVHGGTLTLDGVTLRDGLVLGSDGADGVDGEQGAEGTLGKDGGEGENGGLGGPGGEATPATAGGDGSEGEGGAMLIDGASVVTLRNCRVEQNVAVGGRGGEGGAGGRGGTGGPGGRGGSGPGKNAGIWGPRRRWRRADRGR